MTEKRFTYEEVNFCKDNITDNLFDLTNPNEMLELLNNFAEENEQLKQFQEQVASVIESKMENNVCNDYKMEVLKEIWNELKLDEVWFE